MHYYNEFDPFAAAWLRDLIERKLIPSGHVDTRSITDVAPSDLRGYTQCHFFAGIGGWSYALQLAGWPEDRPVWTGSCPCQPFSVAGKRGGTGDERHLWPQFQRLIAECRPPVVFGEQVASKDGRDWLSGVRADLEALDYAAGATDLCAAGIGAPHIRQRLYWVADANDQGLERRGLLSERPHQRSAGQSSMAGGMDYDGRTSQIDIPWRKADWLFCRDGKWRPVEPGTFPLAHGIPHRVGRLRGYGNAIVPQVAAAFIEAAMMP